MEIESTYYGLADTAFTFTDREVKDALIEYLFNHHRELVPKTFDACEIQIYETQYDYEGTGKETEKSKVILTFHYKNVEHKDDETFDGKN